MTRGTIFYATTERKEWTAPKMSSMEKVAIVLASIGMTMVLAAMASVALIS